MTQKETLDSVLIELRDIKSHLPNGELKVLLHNLNEVKEDMSELKFTLLNPEDGVIVKTNKNTEFRVKMEKGDKEFQTQMMELEDLKRWKGGVNKALWIIFGSIAALVIRLMVMQGGA